MHLDSVQETLHRVIAEAWANPVFKQQLIDDPVAAIKALTGREVQLPPGKTLSVFDQSDNNMICLNIPPPPGVNDKELTEHQLEIVAGGGIFLTGLAIDWKGIFTNNLVSYPAQHYKN
ncbi:TOMM propeptide domain-containing protein [Lewinella sp. LCG006]|uniref:TOMM propeptide domain-containing protein n=1 Tax=Lewinella sp. LCG006 TaxID=3231911 RepID=UPI003460965F